MEQLFLAGRGSSFFKYLGSMMDGGMDGVGDIGKDRVKLSSGRGVVRNIIRCLLVKQYNNSVEDSIINPLYSVKGFLCTISFNSILYSVCLLLDLPPARCELLTEDLVKRRIEELLTEDKYNEILKLDVEKLDEDDLRKAEKMRSERGKYQALTVGEKKGGKGKKKSK